MKWDPKKIENSNKLRGKKILEDAIRTGIGLGLCYEDLCEILAKTINEMRDEGEIK